jgi:ABC-type transport system involved in Fe-S cluster assembly fused permease/ATPase subunit
MRGMRARSSLPPSAPPAPGAPRNDWAVLAILLPYLWMHRGRVLVAIVCLVGAKLAMVGVPILLKHIVDAFTAGGTTLATTLVVVPIALIVAYGLLRLSTSLFTELREFFFARVTQATVRTLALKTFRHLHALSLRFHLERRTGSVTREIDHGIRGISSLVSFTLYSILPTLVEMALVLGYLLINYEIWFALIVAVSLGLYITFTVLVTNWRTQFRRQVNELDAKASSRAVDSLLNFETVKYFNNEEYEARRYDGTLAQQEAMAIKSQQSLNLLNSGQQLIIAIGLTLMLWRAAVGVSAGRMSIGDLVLVNAFMLQLYVPLNFLGVIYREIKQALTDMDRMFLLLESHRDVADAHDARPLALRPHASPEVRFEHVDFAYDPRRQVLFDVDFVIRPGTTTAVVGATGSGKSTLARLLFRFYDVQGGCVRIDGQDVRAVTQASLRGAIGIVPQDTVLFNDTIGYNIGYGRPGATHGEIVAAARSAHIHEFIERLPDGYDTVVGERGLKLSGGEKQRVAIARTLLKRPAILVFDEATSALDSRTERVIQAELEGIAAQRTTLVIAHRLSTIVHADQILVMEQGRIIEVGTHDALLERGGIYARMWAMQSRQPAMGEGQGGEGQGGAGQGEARGSSADEGTLAMPQSIVPPAIVPSSVIN